MKNKLLIALLAITTVFCCMFALVACDNGDDLQEVAVTGVTLNKTELTLEIGGEETLTATVTPDNAADKTVTWTADKPEIASVDDNGKVTAKTEGTAVITVKAGAKSATCTVTVNAAAFDLSVAGRIFAFSDITSDSMTAEILAEVKESNEKSTFSFDNDNGFIQNVPNLLIVEKGTYTQTGGTGTIIITSVIYDGVPLDQPQITAEFTFDGDKLIIVADDIVATYVLQSAE